MKRISDEKLLKWSMAASLSHQVALILSGFIIPRLILLQYGSEINGLVSSVTQMLSLVSLAQMGLGAVLQTAFYAPLANEDELQISRIYVSARRFFNQVAATMSLYVLALIVLYPKITRGEFDFLFTAVLIVAIAIHVFSQYYIGITDRILLWSAQRIYIVESIGTALVILNVAASIVLIRAGASIQIVKFVTAFIFLLSPLIIRWHVRRNFRIRTDVQLDGEPIRQKWNGVAQHIAYVVLENTDVALLTLFADLKSVSVYSVYYLVINGLKICLTSLTKSVDPFFGKLYAKDDKERLFHLFGYYEWLVHNTAVFIYTVTAILIVPFVALYTNGVRDADYANYVFGALMSLSGAAYLIRLPYLAMVNVAGHFRETQNSAIIEAGLNIGLSACLIFRYGIIGVAVGTICALSFRTAYMVWYLSGCILCRSPRPFLKQLALDALSVALIILSMRGISLNASDYVAWTLTALWVSLRAFVVLLAVNLLLRREYAAQLIKRALRVFAPNAYDGKE